MFNVLVLTANDNRRTRRITTEVQSEAYLTLGVTINSRKNGDDAKPALICRYSIYAFSNEHMTKKPVSNIMVTSDLDVVDFSSLRLQYTVTITIKLNQKVLREILEFTERLKSLLAMIVYKDSCNDSKPSEMHPFAYLNAYVTDTAKYKIIESEKVSALWCNGSTFTRQVRDPGSTPGGANTAKYKIIESEKVSALWCNGSTFTRQVRDPGSTPGGASTFLRFNVY
ncbi:hypothetical protein J6590_094652 [Homalodisca vitripennis]|nr:hypothetical protein J6590_094652 [Homalodisca vitripennis]